MKVSSSFLLIIIVLFFNPSCTKDSLPNAAGDHISKVVYYRSATPDMRDSTVFTYDLEKRITQEVFYTNSFYGLSGTTTVTYEYDSQGRLSKYTYGNNAAGNMYSYIFAYNTDGKIIKETGTPLLSSFAEPDDHVFTYDSKGRLISDTTYYQHTLKKTKYCGFKYDGNDNVIESGQVGFDFITGIINDRGSFSLKYDNNVSSFGKMGLMFYFTRQAANYLSKNNAVARSDDPNKTRYYYYSNGLPKTATSSDSQGTSIAEYYYK